MEDFGHVRSYSSFEEMQADLAERHEAAMANMTSSQRAIGYGDYACNISMVEEIGPVYGTVQSLAEVRAWHDLYYGSGDAEEAKYILARRGIFDPPSTLPGPDDRPWEDDGFSSAAEATEYYVNQHIGSWENGYLFGFWFSNIETKGELGSAHASVCVPISEEVYFDAFTHGGYVTVEHGEEIVHAIRTVQMEMAEKEAMRGGGDDSGD